jgi:hypothetical protein
MLFKVHPEASKEMTAFCDIAPCDLVQFYRRFVRTYCLHHQDRPIDGGNRQPGTSVNLHKTAWPNILEDCRICESYKLSGNTEAEEEDSFRGNTRHWWWLCAKFLKACDILTVINNNTVTIRLVFV